MLCSIVQLLHIILFLTQLQDHVIKISKIYKPTQVEERLVGAVLGPSGRHVEEIKQYRYYLFKIVLLISAIARQKH